jgi:ARG/rhodanese/phosphatase superfamily protein
MSFASFKTLGVAVLACGLGVAGAATAQAPRTPAGQRISGPFTHANLSVFLIHGPGRSSGRPLVTLQEALAQKKVVVHETGNVNELAVENVSADADVYIQSGDIVKGGRQDRMIAQDFIVPARSGKMPIASFCVEHGRWSRRGNEAAHAFNGSSDQVAGKALKMAARRDGDQGRVWQEVAANQAKLSKSLGAPVAAAESASSFQLTLENAKVTAGVEDYVRALSARGLAPKDVVGCAFAVNGQLSGAEVYASRELFERLWPKLLKAAAVEAIAEQGGVKAAPRAPADVRQWMAEADRAGAQEKAVGPRVKLRTREAPANVVFETLDTEDKDGVLHKSYVAK